MVWCYSASIITFLLVGGLVLYPPETQGYPTPVDFDGKLLRWNIAPSEQVFYTIGQAAGDRRELYETLAFASAELWNGVATSSIELAYTENPDLAQITIDFEGSNDGDTFSSGYAVFDGVDDDGPTHCTIKILGGEASLLSLAKTVLHEFGHCLGLGHSLVPEAIMSYQLDRNEFALSLDDRAAISRLYPLDEYVAELPPGCGVSADLAAHPWRSMLLLLLPVMGLLLPRRSRDA